MTDPDTPAQENSDSKPTDSPAPTASDAPDTAPTKGDTDGDGAVFDGKDKDSAKRKSGGSRSKAKGASRERAADGDSGGSGKSSSRSSRTRTRRKPKAKSSSTRTNTPLNPKEWQKKAWQLFLADIAEEGTAMFDDQEANKLARRSFELAAIYLRQRDQIAAPAKPAPKPDKKDSSKSADPVAMAEADDSPAESEGAE